MGKVEGKTLKYIFNYWYTEGVGDRFEGKYSLLIDVAEVIEMFHKIMHKNGYNFGHGDLNLSNIMVTSNGEIKLIDFAFDRKMIFEKDWEYFFERLLEMPILDKKKIKGIEKDYLYMNKLLEKSK
jgi:RIO-like serine/threonine protein kinase